MLLHPSFKIRWKPSFGLLVPAVIKQSVSVSCVEECALGIFGLRFPPCVNLPDPVAGSWERNSVSLLLGWLVWSGCCWVRTHICLQSGGLQDSNGVENISTLGNWSEGPRCSPWPLAFTQEGHSFMRIIRNQNDNHLFGLYLYLIRLVWVLMTSPFISSIASLQKNPRFRRTCLESLPLVWHLSPSCCVPSWRLVII